MGPRATPGPCVPLTWPRCCCSACRQPPPPPAGRGSPAGTQQKGCHGDGAACEHPGTAILHMGTHTPVPTHMHRPMDTPQPLHTPAHTYANAYMHPKPQTTMFPAPLTLRPLSPAPAAPQAPRTVLPCTVRPRDRVQPTLLCSTTTLCAAALSHVSMALQMLQIFSSAGVCRSGHPKSSNWVVMGDKQGSHPCWALPPLQSPACKA